MWDLKMIIEFPPGSTVLIPSAVVSHSNTEVRAHETRYSITQYTAGGLFRWVACGGRSLKDFSAAGERFAFDADERWRRGVELLSTWEELKSMYAT